MRIFRMACAVCFTQFGLMHRGRMKTSNLSLTLYRNNLSFVKSTFCAYLIDFVDKHRIDLSLAWIESFWMFLRVIDDHCNQSSDGLDNFQMGQLSSLQKKSPAPHSLPSPPDQRKFDWSFFYHSQNLFFFANNFCYFFSLGQLFLDNSVTTGRNAWFMISSCCPAFTLSFFLTWYVLVRPDMGSIQFSRIIWVIHDLR